MREDPHHQPFQSDHSQASIPPSPETTPLTLRNQGQGATGAQPKPVPIGAMSPQPISAAQPTAPSPVPLAPSPAAPRGTTQNPPPRAFAGRQVDETELQNKRSFSTTFFCISIIIVLIAMQWLCYVNFVCWITDGTLIAMAVSVLIIPITALSILLLWLTYYSLDAAIYQIMRGMRWVDILYGIIMLIVGVIILITGNNMSKSDKKEVWNKLSTYSKEYFDNDQDEMLDDYRYNMTWVGSICIIVGILFLIGFFLIYNLIATLENIEGEWKPGDLRKMPERLPVFRRVEKATPSLNFIILEKFKGAASHLREAQQKKAMSFEQQRAYERKMKQIKAVTDAHAAKLAAKSLKK